MLKRAERLRFSGLFLQAFSKGRTIQSENLKLTCTKTLPQYASRLPLVGFVVSKTYSKSSVKRNRIKRQLREIYRIFRLEPENQEFLFGLGLIVISLKSTCIETDFHKLQKELLGLFNQL